MDGGVIREEHVNSFTSDYRSPPVQLQASIPGHTYERHNQVTDSSTIGVYDIAADTGLKVESKICRPSSY